MVGAIVEAFRVVDPYGELDGEDALELERVLLEQHGLQLVSRDEMKRYENLLQAAVLHNELPGHRLQTLTFLQLAVEDIERGRRESEAARAQALEAALRDESERSVDQDRAAPDAGKAGEGSPGREE